MTERKISGFKKFSDLNVTPDKDSELSAKPFEELPANPNLPKNSKKIGKVPSKKGTPEPELDDKTPLEEANLNEENNVQIYGKVAKFPKRTKASRAYNFLENIKISKGSIWYILVEKQENELQMVKYNNKKGFDLAKFVFELKEFYKKRYDKNENISKLIESIQISGAEDFSSIRNIPNIEIDGKKLIAIITEDLIRLLSK